MTDKSYLVEMRAMGIGHTDAGTLEDRMTIALRRLEQ